MQPHELKLTVLTPIDPSDQAVSFPDFIPNITNLTNMCVCVCIYLNKILILFLNLLKIIKKVIFDVVFYNFLQTKHCLSKIHSYHKMDLNYVQFY